MRRKKERAQRDSGRVDVKPFSHTSNTAKFDGRVINVPKRQTVANCTEKEREKKKKKN